MKWLITGGCGFIGTNLTGALLQAGDSVIVLDNLSRRGSLENLKWLQAHFADAFRFLPIDIRDTDQIDRTVREFKPEVIAHLAGQVAMTTSIADPRLDFETNALGTFNILEAVRLHSPATTMLYSSTNKVYGSLSQIRTVELESRYVLPDYPDGLDENIPLEGHSPYGCSKLTGDQYVHDYSRIYGIPTVVFRHSSMYGGRQYATFDQGWIGWFCQQAIAMQDTAAEPFTINGDGKQVRDVLYADDLISAYQMAVRNIKTTAGRIYNIGGGSANSLSLLELFAILEDLTGNTLRYRRLEWRSGDQRVFIADIQRARADFDWFPVITKEIGIRRMLEWCQEISK